MKAKLTTIILVGVGLFSLGGLRAQNSVQAIHEKARGMVRTIEGLGYEVVHTQVDILSTSKDFRTTIRDFSAQYDYLVTVFGDDRIQETYLSILDEREDELFELQTQRERDEDDPMNLSLLEFSPEQSEPFMVYVASRSFAEGNLAGHYAMIVANRRRNEEPSASIATDGEEEEASIGGMRWTTASKAVGQLNDDLEPQELGETSSYVSFFTANAAGTIIEHVTDEITSKYLINELEWDAAHQLFSIEVTSDAGNDYLFLLFMEENMMWVVNREGQYYLSYELKQIWK